MTTTSVINNIQSWLTICQQNKKIWQIFKIIIKDNIPQTPSKVGVLERWTFSHTPEEAMSVGLAKACVPRKNWFCSREIEFLNFHWIFEDIIAMYPHIDYFDIVL